MTYEETETYLLSRKGIWVTTKIIGKETRQSESAVRNALRRLINDGKVTREDRGVHEVFYRIPDGMEEAY